MNVLLRQATVIDTSSSFHGQVVDLLMKDGVIQSIAPHIDSKDIPEITGTGLYVSTGWVDALADYREPGYEQKETILTGLNAAAAGGFTDVLLAPNTNAVLDNKSAIQYVLGRSKDHPVQLHPLGAISREIAGKNLAEMMDMRAQGAIAFTDGWQPVQNSNLFLKALEYVKAFDGLLLQIPVDTALAAGGLMHEGVVSTRLGMPGVPALAETLMVHRDIELVRYTGSRLHITGVSTAESVAMIRVAKAQGLDITCAVTPYHLALNDEALSTYNNLYKVSPPLRTEQDRLALVAALKDGTIDCIASHHRPQDWDATAREFEYAGEGMNVQQLTFQIIWSAAGEEIGLDRLIAALTTAPRTIFGLPVASIEAGNTVPLTIFTTDGSSSYQQSDMKSLGQNNPFLGKALKGKVVGIINNSTTS